MKLFTNMLILMLFACELNAGWILQSSPVNADLYNVNFHHGNENIAWACGKNGVIVHTTNGGINWVLQNSGTLNDLYAVTFMEISGNPVIAVGANGTILRTTNFGTNWVLIPSPVTTTLRDISDFNFFAVGDSGTIIKSSNQGLNWSVISSPTSKNLYAIAATFGHYAVGEDGIIIAPMAGNIWAVIQSGVTSSLNGVPLFGSRNIVAGDNGLVLRSTNLGVNWVATNTQTTKNLKSLEFSVNNNDKVYCVGDSGTILKTTNFGNTWGTQVSGTTNDLNSTFFYLDDNTGYAVGDNGTILKTTDGGGAITSVEHIINDPVDYILFQNYPNPFNPKTIIDFTVPFQNAVAKSIVKLVVYNSSGKEISVLVNEHLQAGSYTYSWDASAFPSGIYYYRLSAGIFNDTRKMILLK